MRSNSWWSQFEPYPSVARGQKPVPPVNIPIRTKIDQNGWCTYPKMGSQNGFEACASELLAYRAEKWDKTSRFLGAGACKAFGRCRAAPWIGKGQSEVTHFVAGSHFGNKAGQHEQLKTNHETRKTLCASYIISARHRSTASVPAISTLEFKRCKPISAKPMRQAPFSSASTHPPSQFAAPAVPHCPRLGWCRAESLLPELTLAPWDTGLIVEGAAGTKGKWW